MVVLLVIFGPLAADYDAAYSFVREQSLNGRFDDRIRRIVNSFDQYPELRASIARCDSVKLYEGLPHQSWERLFLEQELAAKKTIKLGNYPFYAESIEISPEDTGRLKSIYRSWWSFAPFRGFKDCGGYHPDYCLAWSDGSSLYLVQICLGCHEMKTFADGKELYCEIRSGAFAELKAILLPYRKNRSHIQLLAQIGVNFVRSGSSSYLKIHYCNSHIQTAASARLWFGA